MRPLASFARETRFLGLVELGVAFFFAIVAALLNPIELAVGALLGTPVMFAAMYFGVLRGRVRRVIAEAAPARTNEREEPGAGALGRRVVWPVAGEVAVLLFLAGVGRAPGLMSGLAFGVGLALWQTSRQIERWEVAHSALLLREPGTRRFFLARGEEA
jgi:hypothetical protein